MDAPRLEFAPPGHGARTARCWVHEAPGDAQELNDAGAMGRLRFGLHKAHTDGKLDFALVLRRETQVFLVIALPREVTKQAATDFLRGVCDRMMLAALDLEAFDAFFCERLGWLTPDDPADQVAAAMQAAADALPGWEAEALQRHLPLLRRLPEEDVRTWYKGGLLDAALLRLLSGPPPKAVQDCLHELQRSTSRKGCTCVGMDNCACGADERRHWPCCSCKRGGEPILDWNCKVCDQRWCHGCAMQLQRRRYDEEAIESLAAELAKGLPQQLQAAQQFPQLGDHSSQVSSQLLSLEDNDEDDDPWHGPAMRELAAQQAAAAASPARAWAAIREHIRGDAEAEAHLARMARECPGLGVPVPPDFDCLAAGQMGVVQVVQKSRMQQSRRVAYVLYRVNLQGIDASADVSFLPAFYAEWHQLFRGDFTGAAGASNCQQRALEAFAEWARSMDPAFRMPALKDMPPTERAAVESVTRGALVRRCLACSSKLLGSAGRGDAFCSAACAGVCRCAKCACIAGPGRRVHQCPKCRGQRGQKRSVDGANQQQMGFQCVSWGEVLEPDRLQPQWWRDQCLAYNKREALRRCLAEGRAPYWPAPSREEMERLIAAPLPAPTDEPLLMRKVLVCNDCRAPLELLFRT